MSRMLLRCRRRLLAGHLFACQQRQRRLDRQLILAGHAVVAFGLAFLRQFGLQVGGDTRHVARADDFDADLFQCVVDVLRFAPRRHAGGVHRIVVMAQAQRDASDAPRRRAISGGGNARVGSGRRARLPDEAGWAGLERHLHVRHFGDRAQHARGGALEFFSPGVVFVGAAHCVSALRRPPPFAGGGWGRGLGLS